MSKIVFTIGTWRKCSRVRCHIAEEEYRLLRSVGNFAEILFSTVFSEPLNPDYVKLQKLGAHGGEKNLDAIQDYKLFLLF